MPPHGNKSSVNSVEHNKQTLENKVSYCQGDHVLGKKGFFVVVATLIMLYKTA